MNDDKRLPQEFRIQDEQTLENLRRQLDGLQSDVDALISQAEATPLRTEVGGAERLGATGERGSRHDDPSEDNECTIVCRACGEREHIERDFCRCGAFLLGQLRDEHACWARHEKHRLSRLEARDKVLVNVSYWAAVLPGLTVLAVLSLDSSGRVPMDVIEAGTCLSTISLIMFLALRSFFERRRRSTSRMLANLDFVDFLRRVYGCSGIGVDRGRHSARILLAAAGAALISDWQKRINLGRRKQLH